jgi:hypothetical protein
MEKFVNDALVQGAVTEYTLEQSKVYLTSGQWVAIAFVDAEDVFHGVAAVSFINYPNDRVAFFTVIGGTHITNTENMEQLKEICRAHGATTMQAFSRESVARLWKSIGFDKRSILVETKL